MPGLVRGCLEHVVVIHAVNLEHEHGPVRKIPLGIRPSTTTLSIPAALLASGGCHSEPCARATEIDLRQRVGPAGDVVQQRPDFGCPPQRSHPRKPVAQPIRRGEPLLDGGRDRAVRGPSARFVGGEQQYGRLELTQRQGSR
jgi:hypothetical protein